MLPEGLDFPGAAPVLAAAVGLPIPGGVRDLDDVVRRIGTREMPAGSGFAQLVAYAGETIIATRGGAWDERLASDGTTWERWVVDGSQREHAPFGIVYKDLAEWGRGSSLTGALSASLTPLRS